MHQARPACAVRPAPCAPRSRRQEPRCDDRALRFSRPVGPPALIARVLQRARLHHLGRGASELKVSRGHITKLAPVCAPQSAFQLSRSARVSAQPAHPNCSKDQDTRWVAPKLSRAALVVYHPDAAPRPPLLAVSSGSSGLSGLLPPVVVECLRLGGMRAPPRAVGRPPSGGIPRFRSPRGPPQRGTAAAAHPGRSHAINRRSCFYFRPRRVRATSYRT